MKKGGKWQKRQHLQAFVCILLYGAVWTAAEREEKQPSAGLKRSFRSDNPKKRRKVPKRIYDPLRYPAYADCAKITAGRRTGGALLSF